MKKLIIVLLTLSYINLVACGKGQEINGHNMKTAYYSVKWLKNIYSVFVLRLECHALRDIPSIFKT